MGIVRTENNWIQTYSGCKFWPMDPRIEDISLKDIAHSLSLQCRFTGHSSRHYSIAEHSLLVSSIVPAEFKLQALLHDASEAYLADLPRPLKHLAEFKFYRDAEARLQSMIYEKFGCASEMSELVRNADTAALGLEAYWIMNARREEPAWMFALQEAEKHFGWLSSFALPLSERIETSFTDAVIAEFSSRRAA